MSEWWRGFLCGAVAMYFVLGWLDQWTRNRALKMRQKERDDDSR